MMKVDLEDVTSRQVRRNNIYFDTIESFSLFSLVNILGSRLDYFLFLPCPFRTILDLLMFSFIFSPFSLFFQPRLILFFLFHLLQHHPPNVPVLSLHLIHSFSFHSILFPSHSPSCPILFSFTFFPSVYHSIAHPFPSSLLSILLASCPNPSSYYSLLILSLSCTVFII